MKKLRRPTVAAWALDRLADVAPDEVGALLDAGAELARAQRATLSGRDPQKLREATAKRRDLVAELSQTAADALRDAGRSPDTHLEDIRGTLEAASVDEEIGERLRTGTLERTSRPAAGFGDIAGLQLVSRRDDAPEVAATVARIRGRAAVDRGDERRRGACARARGGGSGGSAAIATPPSAGRRPPRKPGHGWRSRWRRCSHGSTRRARSSGMRRPRRPSSG